MAKLNKLKEIREHRNYSQEYLAEKLGKSAVSISHIETGRNGISKKLIPKLCEVLDCTIEQLFGVVPIKKEEDVHKENFSEINNDYIKIAMKIIDSVTESGYLTKEERLKFLGSVYPMVHDFYESDETEDELYQKIVEYKKEAELKEAFFNYAKNKLIKKKN